MWMRNELLSVGIVVVKIGVLLIEANDFVESVVGVKITVVVAVEGVGLGLLHGVIKKLALKSFLALFLIFKFGSQLIQIWYGFYLNPFGWLLILFQLLYALLYGSIGWGRLNFRDWH
jgi:hypothetical protein